MCCVKYKSISCSTPSYHLPPSFLFFHKDSTRFNQNDSWYFFLFIFSNFLPFSLLLCLIFFIWNFRFLIYVIFYDQRLIMQIFWWYLLFSFFIFLSLSSLFSLFIFSFHRKKFYINNYHQHKSNASGNVWQGNKSDSWRTTRATF